MNDSAFIQAIRDAPDDDLPRLIYADYLDDQGQAARAEFIRVQCELTRGVRDRGRSLELLRRLRELLALYRREWLGELSVHAPDTGFARGFVDRATLQARAFIVCAKAILAAHPISRVTLREAGMVTDDGWGRVTLHEASKIMHDLAACPELALLRALDLRNNSLGAPGIGALAGSAHLQSLRELVLTDCGIGGSDMRILVAPGNLRGLETLLLDGNHLLDGGVEALACSPNLARLTRLDLSRNEVTDRGVAMLAGSPHLPRLASLRLASNQLTRAGIETLLSSRWLGRLTLLDVSGNNLQRHEELDLRRQFAARILI